MSRSVPPQGALSSPATQGINPDHLGLRQEMGLDLCRVSPTSPSTPAGLGLGMMQKNSRELRVDEDPSSH